MSDNENLETPPTEWPAPDGDEAHLKESLANTAPDRFYLSNEPKPAHVFRLNLI